MLSSLAVTYRDFKFVIPFMMRIWMFLTPIVWSMELVPREEWRQIFQDTWRRYRDFFYDPQMHGVDWDTMRVLYGKLVEDARSRWDLSFIGSNMIAELSAGHTYTFGEGPDQVKRLSTGFLGINWELTDKGYRIKRIIRPAPWDTEVRSPFDRPGSSIKVGDFIHAVNGIPLDASKDPYAAFEGLAGKTVSLSTSSTGDPREAETTVIKCLDQGEETNHPYLEHDRGDDARRPGRAGCRPTPT